MPALVTLEETKKALRIYHDDEDDTYEMLIDAASLSVLAYLKSGADGFISSGDVVDDTLMPKQVKWATILLVGYLSENRDSDPNQAFDMGYLPKPVMALLYALRDPALA